MEPTHYFAASAFTQVVNHLPLILAAFVCLIVVVTRRGLPGAAKWLAGFGCVAVLLAELTRVAWQLSFYWLATHVLPLTVSTLNIAVEVVNVTLNLFSAIGICLLVVALSSAGRRLLPASAPSGQPTARLRFTPTGTPATASAQGYPTPPSTDPAPTYPSTQSPVN